MSYAPLFNFLLVLVLGLSGVFTLLMGVALVTYVRRTWQLMRAEEDGSIHERILDGVDHLEAQVHLLGERMERLERRLPAPDGEGEEDERVGGRRAAETDVKGLGA